MAARDSTRVLPHTCRTCGALFTPIKFRKQDGVFRAYTGRQNCSAECAFAAKGKVTKKRMADTRDQWVGPKNPSWTGACLRKNRSYRGPDWVRIAESARKRDGHFCQHCGMTQAQHLSRWNQVLEVHHKIPFTEFTDHVRANRLANLVTLCKSCHMKADKTIRQRQMLMSWDDEPRKKSAAVVAGSRNPRALIVESQVIEIKRLLRSGMRQEDIGNLFSVKKHVISAISTGQNWRQVPWPS